MQYALLWGVAKKLYQTMFRDLLVKAIDDPETDWDDVALSLADALFSYKP